MENQEVQEKIYGGISKIVTPGEMRCFKEKLFCSS